MNQKRLGRCYELAGREAVERASSGEAVVLVHGTIGPQKNPHAWLEYEEVYDVDGRQFELTVCWEPASENVVPKDAFVAIFRAVEHARYGESDVRRLSLQWSHWGPWTGSYWKVERRGRKKVEPSQL